MLVDAGISHLYWFWMGVGRGRVVDQNGLGEWQKKICSWYQKEKFSRLEEEEILKILIKFSWVLLLFFIWRGGNCAMHSKNHEILLFLLLGLRHPCLKKQHGIDILHYINWMATAEKCMRKTDISFRFRLFLLHKDILWAFFLDTMLR